MIRSLLKKRKGHADTHKEEELGRMEAETGARQLEAEDCMEPQKVEEVRRDSSSEP